MARAQSVYFVGEGHILSYQEHDAILQTLDRASKGIFLGKDFFVKNLDAWNNVPLIYGQDHPEPSAYNEDAAKELARIKARPIDGHVSGASIELTGHPRLMATLNIDDEEVESGIEAGQISISTAFLAPHDDKQLTGDVAPHHILFFREEPGTQPGDKGAFILNTDDHDKSLLAKLRELLGVKSQVEFKEPAMPEEGKDMAESKELEAKLAEEVKRAESNRLLFTDAEAKLKSMDGEIARLKAENLAFVAKEKDGKWLEFSKRVPPGMIAGEKAAEARKEYEADPAAFAMKVLDFREKQVETAQSGVEFTAKSGAPAKDEDRLHKMGIPSIEIIDKRSK